MSIKQRLIKLEEKVGGKQKVIIELLCFGKDTPLPEPIIGDVFDVFDVLFAYADDVHGSDDNRVNSPS